LTAIAGKSVDLREQTDLRRLEFSRGNRVIIQLDEATRRPRCLCREGFYAFGRSATGTPEEPA
jgi:hypothetical protein